MNFKYLNNLTGWVVFAIATLVYGLSAEPTGSLWDCGEFISSAYKLQVCHPPGAPLFLMVGRLFTWVATLISKDPETIAYSVNLLSGVCTAFAALFVFWTTTLLAKLLIVGRDTELTNGADIIAVLASGVVAGLATTFATSVWFSAVEGEVYAMSLGFSALTIWSMMRWYATPDSPGIDRWLLFTAYMLGLSSTVHLLSLLTLPAFSLMYYFKRYEKQTLMGSLLAFMAGVGLLGLFQFFIIPVLPTIGAHFDYVFVNSMGMPFGSGMVFFILVLSAGIYFALRYAQKQNMPTMEKFVLSFALVMMGFSTYTLIYVRAQANTPINMNNPSDPYSLVSYLKREQYGERPLFNGPHFAAQRPEDGEAYKETGDVYRPVNGQYEVVDKKGVPVYRDEDYMLLPRLGHVDDNQARGYRQWLGLGEEDVPTQADNMRFLFSYQIGWMYWRYFMWNFVGRQNAEQGYFSGDPTNGNWLSGVSFIDDSRLFNQSALSARMKDDPSRNTYYFLPLIFGLIGMFLHFRSRGQDATIVLLLFVMTGLAIVMYLNEPPIEPRERDYGHAGSMSMFAVWIGLSVAGLYQLLKDKLGNGALGIGLLAFTAPLIMVSQNWNDHSRAGHYGARDYASNFLNSVEKNAIIFTYGDNDTYPLWYAQEVEGIRKDVRVVNFSLLAVDWYINQLRRKVNESDAIKMTIPSDAYRGELRNVLYVANADAAKKTMNILDWIKFMGDKHEVSLGGGERMPSYVPALNINVPVDIAKCRANGLIPDSMPDSLVKMAFSMKNTRYLQKDDIAMFDIIANNFQDRPVYYAVTCRPEKVGGLRPFLRMEGMGLRVVPVASKANPGIGGVLGYGEVDIEKTYDAIMNKWRWGNFDKLKTFIDRSYMPSVQSIQIVMIRLIDALLQSGDKERATNVCMKYFEAFPDFNFEFDKNQATSVIQYMYQANSAAKAKPFVETLVDELADNFKMMYAISPTAATDLPAWYSADMAYQRAYSLYKNNPSVPDNIKAQLVDDVRKAQAKMEAAESQLVNSSNALYYMKEDYGRYQSAANTMIRLTASDSTNSEFAKTVKEKLAPYIPAEKPQVPVQQMPN